MTIQELKDKKQALEEEIAEKIRLFEKETGVNISSIKYNCQVYDIGFPIIDRGLKIDLDL